MSISYLESRLSEVDDIVFSRHAERRASMRGLDTEVAVSALSNGDILGVKKNDNPNVAIEFVESYLVLLESDSGELFYLPIYFRDGEALITTVLKLSESNIGLLEW